MSAGGAARGGVALVNVPFVSGARHRHNYYRGGTYPNPSLAYLAGYLHHRGHPCDVVDGKLEGSSIAAILARLSASRPRLVGLTSFTTEIDDVMELARAVRAALPESRIVLGGVHASALPLECLERCEALDVVAIGEGEEILEDILERDVPPPAGLTDVPGLALRIGRETVRTEPRTTTRDRTGARAWFGDMERADLHFTLTYRGCPFPCSFCFRAGGTSVRFRGLDDVMAELLQVAELGGTRSVGVIDATFAVSRERAEAFCKRILAEGLDRRIAWRCSTRVDAVTPALLSLMKAAGCVGVGFGIESGSDRILRTTGKHVTSDACVAAVRAARAAGLATVGFFVLGHPREERADVEQTVALVARLNPDVASIAIMSPYPGTEVFELARRGEAGYRLMSRDYARYEEAIGDVLAFAAFDVAYLKRARLRALLALYLGNGRVAELLATLYGHRELLVRRVTALLRRQRRDDVRHVAAHNSLSWRVARRNVAPSLHA